MITERHIHFTPRTNENMSARRPFAGSAVRCRARCSSASSAGAGHRPASPRRPPAVGSKSLGPGAPLSRIPCIESDLTQQPNVVQSVSEPERDLPAKLAHICGPEDVPHRRKAAGWTLSPPEDPARLEQNQKKWVSPHGPPTHVGTQRLLCVGRGTGGRAYRLRAEGRKALGIAWQSPTCSVAPACSGRKSVRRGM